jgi:ABC-type transport system involved in cytochrome c biogenesis permease component
MNAFWEHFWVTMKLTLRNKQALIMAYCVPILGLIAFGTYFRSSTPLRNEIAQVLTICIMGAACFGLPTSFVTERERGVWRRYRLTPIWNGWLILSTLLARYLIVLTSGLLQIALAMTLYNMPAPLHPFQMFVAFSVSSFAFLGMGLVIAMIVSSPLAVQGDFPAHAGDRRRGRAAVRAAGVDAQSRDVPAGILFGAVDDGVHVCV